MGVIKCSEDSHGKLLLHLGENSLVFDGILADDDGDEAASSPKVFPLDTPGEDSSARKAQAGESIVTSKINEASVMSRPDSLSSNPPATGTLSPPAVPVEQPQPNSAAPASAFLEAPVLWSR